MREYVFGWFCLVKIKTVLKIPKTLLNPYTQVSGTHCHQENSIDNILELGVPGIKEQVKLNYWIDRLDELVHLEDEVAGLRDRVAH